MEEWEIKFNELEENVNKISEGISKVTENFTKEFLRLKNKRRRLFEEQREVCQHPSDYRVLVEGERHLCKKCGARIVVPHNPQGVFC